MVNDLIHMHQQRIIFQVDKSSVQKGREAVELIVRKQAARQKKAQNEKYILRMEYEPELIVRGTVKKI